MKEQKRIHLIANSHIDPVWLWDKYEGIDEVINTFRSACDRLDECPGLHFSASSLQFYQWCLEHDPELFTRIRKHVADGRWEITGGWWIEPDTNLPLGVSVQKQYELSQQFLDTHFDGRNIEVCFLPDTFGHPATLPKLLAQMGQKYFVFSRPGAHEKPDLPGNLFYWECEGHRVLAYRLKHHYTQAKPEDETAVAQRLNDGEYAEQPTNAYFFGVGDHGGGPTLAEIRLYQKFIRADKSIGFSTCLAFFKQAEKIPGIPTYRGDLHRHAVGCYSVMRDLKTQIRGSEHGLGYTARALAMNGASPDALNPLWQKTLFNQFHDIMPGSCAPDAADMARAEMGGVEDGWRTAAYNALKKLSAARPVQCPQGEFRIFNTLPYPITVPLAVESFMYFVPGAPFCNAQGHPIEIQEVLPSVRCSNRRWAFVDTLPARGFNTYHFDATAKSAAPDPAAAHYREGGRIAGDAFAIDDSGAVKRRVGPSQEAVVLDGLRFLVLDDTSDTWGHRVVTYDAVIGAFEPQETSILTGPIVQKRYQRLTYNRSTVEVVYSLYKGIAAVDLEITVTWAEDRKILKMELHPEGYTRDRFTMQGPGGPIERPADGSEQPLHHWIILPGDRADFTLIQNGAFACDCKNGRLRVNLVRANLYGYHDPNILHPRDPQHRTDQGVHAFRFRLMCKENARPDDLTRETETFLEPCWVIREGKKT